MEQGSSSLMSFSKMSQLIGGGVGLKMNVSTVTLIKFP
jgi:hypothetical protein